MEKALKIIKTVVITLVVILLSLIAFCGVFSKQNNIWKNSIPEFNYGLELEGIRELRYVLNDSEEEKNVYIDSEGNILGEVKEEEESSVTEDGISLNPTNEAEDAEASEEAEETAEDKPNYATELRMIKVNPDEVKTIENFEKTKSIIQKRLENEDVYEYNIRLDNLTGELVVEIPDSDESINIAHSAVTTKGKVEIIDEQTGLILIDKNDIKKTEAGMYQDETGYQACLQIYFNKEGSEKLKDISNKYREVVNDAGESTTSYVSITLDGQTISTTYFGEELTNGVIQIPMGQVTTDSETMNNTLSEVRRIADVINEENLPIAYTLSSDNFIQAGINQNVIVILVAIFVVAILVVSIIFIVKYKMQGFVASILAIGFIAILNLVARYTALTLTINSIIAFVSMIILNYVFMKILLVELKKTDLTKEAFISAIKKYYFAIIPVCIIAVVFTFMSNIVISSIGMILFWGLLIQIAYNACAILALDLI